MLSRLSLCLSIIIPFASMISTGCVHRIMDDPVFIIGGDTPRATLTCNQEFEAVPSGVENRSGDIKWFASAGYNRMTYAQGEWSNWSGGPGTTAPGFAVPINPADQFELQSLFGDSWSTYSEAKNLAFFYFIGRPPQSVSNSCVAVAATAPEKLATGEWDFPATCLSGSRADQCELWESRQGFPRAEGRPMGGGAGAGFPRPGRFHSP